MHDNVIDERAECCDRLGIGPVVQRAQAAGKIAHGRLIPGDRLGMELDGRVLRRPCQRRGYLIPLARHRAISLLDDFDGQRAAFQRVHQPIELAIRVGEPALQL